MILRRTPPGPRGLFGVIVLVTTLAVGLAACRDRSEGQSKAALTTVSTGATALSTADPPTGPVTEAELAEVDDVLHRLDTELDRLDSDMAIGEGDTQQVLLEAAKKRAAAAITRRLLALEHLSSAANSLARLDETQRADLTAQLQVQISGLTSLNAKILGATNEATLRADAQKIVTDYRVYALTVPKARGVVVADIELNAADRLTRLADRLAATIDQIKGKDTTQASADLESLRARLDTVTSAVGPLPAGLLALTPADYPANQPVLEQTRQTLRTGRANLADAASLARVVIADLK